MSRGIPFGSQVFVEGVGDKWLVVEDRLARKYDSRLDVYFNRHEDAVKFGIRKGVRVWVRKSGG
jgi:3D (Asp-Asp-Asp) domain-containing protein